MMDFSKKNRIVLLVLCFVVNGYFAQNITLSELKKLDSLAFFHYEHNRAQKAESTAYEIIEKSKNQKPNLFIINAYTLLGIINKNRGYYITSLENNIHALNLSEKLQDSGRVSACLNNIGVIYQLQSNYTQAIKYFSNSLKIEEKKNNPLQKSIRYYNIGDCYKEIKNFDLALSYFNNSLIIEEKYQNNEGIVYAYLGIAEVYLEMKNSFQAKMVLDKISKRLSNEQIEEKIIYNKLLGTYDLASANIAEAESHLKLAEDLSQKNKINSHILEIYLLQIEALEAKGDISNANRLYKKYIKLNDELTNSEIKNKIEDLTYQNELTKKELEIKLVLEERNLAKKNEQFEKSLRLYDQKITWFVVLILIIAIGLILFGIRKLTNSRKWTC